VEDVYQCFLLKCPTHDANRSCLFSQIQEICSDGEKSYVVPMSVMPMDKTIISKNTKTIVQREFASDVLSSARYHHPFFSERFRSEVFNSDERLLCDNGTSHRGHLQKIIIIFACW